MILESILGPQLYSLFTSSIAAYIHNAHYLLYADNLKLMQPITSNTSQAVLQADFHWLNQWANTWGMFFNKMKCHVLHLGDNNSKYSYSLGVHNLSGIDSPYDLGLLRDAASPCKYSAHLNCMLHKTYEAVFLILHSISSRRADIMCTIFVIGTTNC